MQNLAWRVRSSLANDDEHHSVPAGEGQWPGCAPDSLRRLRGAAVHTAGTEHHRSNRILAPARPGHCQMDRWGMKGPVDGIVLAVNLEGQIAAHPFRPLFDTHSGRPPPRPDRKQPRNRPDKHPSTATRSATQRHFLLVRLSQDTSAARPAGRLINRQAAQTSTASGLCPAPEDRRWHTLRTTHLLERPTTRQVAGRSAATSPRRRSTATTPARWGGRLRRLPGAGCRGPEEPRLVPRRLRELLAGDHGPGRSCLAAGGPGTLPVLRPHGLVSMINPTANWPERLQTVVLVGLGQPAEPGV